MIQGGDVYEDGTSGDSIYGGPFEDENFELLHHIPGTVGMANDGPNTNISQFYITTIPCPHLDGINVVIGYVVKGLNIVHEIANVERRDDDKPVVNCIIEDCGEITASDGFDLNESDETADCYPPWPDDYDLMESINIEEVLTTIKDSGNYYYNRNNFVDSDRKYKKLLRYIDWINKQQKQHNCKFLNNIKIQTLLNLAAVRLKKQRYDDVINLCSQVLEIEKSGKAYYRRGQARLKLKDYDNALTDLQAASKLIPNDVKIMQDCQQAKKLKQNYLQCERSLFSKMIGQEK